MRSSFARRTFVTMSEEQKLLKKYSKQNRTEKTSPLSRTSRKKVPKPRGFEISKFRKNKNLETAENQQEFRN